MRTAVKGNEVAHLWAHEAQEEARNAGRGNFSFYGVNLYSYRTIIGRILKRKGRKAVAIATNWYSATTCKHQCRARQAIPEGMQVFHLDRVDPWQGAAAYLKEYRKRILTLIEKFQRARSGKPGLFEALTETIVEANRFAEFYGLKTRFVFDEELQAMSLEANAQEQRNAEQRRTREARRLQRLEAKRIEDQARRDAWLRGESVEYPASWYDDTRLRIVGDELQTSKGAVVPLEHAKRAFAFVKQCHDTATTYRRNGHSIHLGHYVIDSIDRDGTIHAGCHTIKYEEVLRVAAQVGLA